MNLQKNKLSPRLAEGKKLIKVKAEISEIENRKTTEKNQWVGLLKRLTKLTNSARLRRKRERTQINKIKNEARKKS